MNISKYSGNFPQTGIAMPIPSMPLATVNSRKTFIRRQIAQTKVWYIMTVSAVCGTAIDLP